MGVVDVLSTLIYRDLNVLLADGYFCCSCNLKFSLFTFLQRERCDVDLTEVDVLHLGLWAQLVIDALPKRLRRVGG